MRGCSSGLGPAGLGLERAELAAGGLQIGLCCLVIGLRLFLVCLRDRVTLIEGVGALIVVAALAKGGLTLGNHGLLLIQLGIELADLTNRLAEIGECLIQRHPIVTVIQPNQGLALTHPIGILRLDGSHRARDARHDRNLIAVYIGIIGGNAILRHEIPPRAPGGAGQQKDDDQTQQ
nr:hypothetical protein [Kushneria phosphatilytica]